MKRNTFAVILALMITLVGCGRKDGGITRAEGSHTYEGYPIVYVTPDISAQGILTAYESLEASAGSNVAIKLSSTEKDPGFAWSELIDELCQSLDDPDIVETDADIDFSGYDYTIVLSHFRSHAEVGFNGTIKQIALMSASPEEPSRLADVQSEQEMLANLGKRTADALSGHILYISVMDRLSMESAGIAFPGSNSYNIGILASYDPVALDQACVDFIYMVGEGAPFAEHIASSGGIDTLVHGEEIGLGSRTYALTTLVDNSIKF